MYSAHFELDAFEAVPVACRCRLVVALAEALSAIDLDYLSRVPSPPLYKSGVRYRGQVIGADVWRDVPRLLATGEGACEDLVAWRVAELRLRGELGARIDVDTATDPVSGLLVYHVVVLRADGRREDPSATLGMT